MTDPIRAAAIAELRRVLYDEFSWRTHITEQATKVADLADAMLASGLIDLLERLEFADLITGAVSHFSEERAARWFHVAGEYEIVASDGRCVARLEGCRLYWSPERQDVMGFDGQLYPDDRDSVVHDRCSRAITYAEIFGRWLAKDGEWFALVEETRRRNGEMCRRLDDPESYRLAVDMAAMALEAANFDEYWRWWQRHNFSVFTRCQHCNDHAFGREDCGNCAGQGFVVMSDCPTSIPAKWPAAPPAERECPMQNDQAAG